MTKNTRKSLLSPLSIPEATIGKFRIVHAKAPPDKKFHTSGMRQALFGGQKDQVVSWPFETTWHTLEEKDQGTWMTDLPIEHKQTIDCLRGMRGTVLVGGLGLGLAVKILQGMRAVKQIVVVEKSPEVIELVAKNVGLEQIAPGELRTGVVCGDLFEYLKETGDGKAQFDYAFYDIWQSDGEGTFFLTVCPLLAASKGKVKEHPVCWNEDVMRGQLYHSLESKLLFLQPQVREHLKLKPLSDELPKLWEQGKDIWHNWCQPFFAWWKETQPGPNQTIRATAFYAANYGNWQWPEMWDLAIDNGLWD